MKIDRLFPLKIVRSKLRRRPAYYICRLKTGRVLLFLNAVFCGALISFLFTFYLNSDYLSELFTYLFTRRTKLIPGLRSPDEIIKNYQPRQFSGKSESANYDQNIKYNDFDYLQNETLTYQRRNYSNQAQLLFRLPTKVTISAVLLIFHACQRTADDWFHTTERQRILGAALNLGYGCLVFQALNTLNRCWSHAADIYENEDVQKIFRELDRFYEEHSQLGKDGAFTSKDNDLVLS